MKKSMLAVSALLVGFTAFSQTPTTEPENTPVVTSLEEGTAVVETPDGVAVDTEEAVTVAGEAVENATGLSAEEAEEIVEEVTDAVSNQLEEGEEIVKVGTPQVIRETVEETTVFEVPSTPAPEEEEVVEEEEVYVGASSLDDIINTQGRLTANMSTEKHFQSVWSRKGYFNISYNTAKLEPKADYKQLYSNGSYVNLETMKSDWGAGIQYGRNYSVLKNPVANIFMFNIDFTPLDFNVNHYKKGDAAKLFDSSHKTNTYEGEDYYYLPWNVEKFEYNYGMNVGPSFTFAPFTKIRGANGLHFLKFNVYYHIGYHVSLLHFNPKEEQDAATRSYFEDVYNGTTSKLSLGHGLTNAVGFNVSWKAIGVGYEMRWASLKYQSLDSEHFGKQKYDFKTPTGRVYLEIRL